MDEVAPPKKRTAALFALGLGLARGGALPIVSIVVGVLLTVALVVVAFVLVRQRGAGAPLHDVPAVAASILGWGAGVMLAFAAAAHAIRRDRDLGIRALLRARGASVEAYAGMRVAGLVALVAFVVVGGTLAAGLACLALASGAMVGAIVRGTLAALAYAAAITCLLGPIALAALGARSRAGGYLWLLAVLVVPEMLAKWTRELVPFEWRELVSIPGALGALRHALMPPGAVDLPAVARAVVVLLVVFVATLAIVRAQIARVDREAAA